ncbi:DUF6192 family protein [Streptomyces sp. NBC_00638]|uniref:DUF6192 family protein n=1 Tax=Streptomyces sp. NBC_00638 TaxID=2975794 RepID=UPI00225B9A6F|nr:DUF6192 family protein [Streptomyces sp. NBC_00638]MCX5009154.1 DUF6192 family protein [Streptomyces sp. NBC_00638]
MRLKKMGIRRIGSGSPISNALPWDIEHHPGKRRLINQAPFRGLRYYLRKRMGEPLSERAEMDLRAFRNRVEEGHVLALVEGDGFVYVPREERDGDLVIRWPEDTPLNSHVTLFVDTDRFHPQAEGGQQAREDTEETNPVAPAVRHLDQSVEFRDLITACHSFIAATGAALALEDRTLTDDERTIVHENVARIRARLDRIETAVDTDPFDVDDDLARQGRVRVPRAYGDEAPRPATV